MLSRAHCTVEKLVLVEQNSNCRDGERNDDRHEVLPMHSRDCRQPGYVSTIVPTHLRLAAERC